MTVEEGDMPVVRSSLFSWRASRNRASGASADGGDDQAENTDVFATTMKSRRSRSASCGSRAPWREEERDSLRSLRPRTSVTREVKGEAEAFSGVVCGAGDTARASLGTPRFEHATGRATDSSSSPTAVRSASATPSPTSSRFTVAPPTAPRSENAKTKPFTSYRTVVRVDQRTGARVPVGGAAAADEAAAAAGTERACAAEGLDKEQPHARKFAKRYTYPPTDVDREGLTSKPVKPKKSALKYVSAPAATAREASAKNVRFNEMEERVVFQPVRTSKESLRGSSLEANLAPEERPTCKPTRPKACFLAEPDAEAACTKEERRAYRPLHRNGELPEELGLAQARFTVEDRPTYRPLRRGKGDLPDDLSLDEVRFATEERPTYEPKRRTGELPDELALDQARFETEERPTYKPNRRTGGLPDELALDQADPFAEDERNPFRPRRTKGDLPAGRDAEADPSAQEERTSYRPRRRAELDFEADPSAQEERTSYRPRRRAELDLEADVSAGEERTSYRPKGRKGNLPADLDVEEERTTYRPARRRKSEFPEEPDFDFEERPTCHPPDRSTFAAGSSRFDPFADDDDAGGKAPVVGDEDEPRPTVKARRTKTAGKVLEDALKDFGCTASRSSRDVPELDKCSK